MVDRKGLSPNFTAPAEYRAAGSIRRTASPHPGIPEHRLGYPPMSQQDLFNLGSLLVVPPLKGLRDKFELEMIQGDINEAGKIAIWNMSDEEQRKASDAFAATLRESAEVVRDIAQHPEKYTDPKHSRFRPVIKWYVQLGDKAPQFIDEVLETYHLR